MEKSFTGGRPQTSQNPSLPSSRPGSRGLYRRCEGNGCGHERPSSAASTEDFTSPAASIMSLAGSSCVNLRTAGDGRPGTASTTERRPGTAGSISQSVRSMYSCKSMASSMSRRHSRKQSCVALSFDQLFTQSFSRASKRMACERKEGIRPGTALRDRKQYRSLHRWWTMAELKVAEEAGDLEEGSDGNSTASGLGDDHSGKEVQKAPTAPATPMLGARRRSIEALLEKRRTSLKAAKMMKEIANATPQAPEEEQKEEQPKHRKFKKARGMTIDVSEVKDPDLIEILQLPPEHEVRTFLGESSGADEFTEKEIARLRKAFVKHRSTFSLEIHSDDIPQILDYLGHLKISAEKIQEYVSEITKYSTLEFDEFVSFMLLARAYDHEEVSKIFTKFDADGSGELSVEELEDVLKSLGITPFRSTISGALAVVDSDDSGTLDFQEFVQLLLIYRKTEGFCEAEIMKLYRIFRRFAEELKDGSGRFVLPSALSSKALMEMFGSQTALLASRLGSELPRPPSEQSDADEEGKRTKSVDGDGMTLREFLLWARRLREVEVEWYRQEFERADVDKGGYLDQDEIRLVQQRVGYTPLRAVILDLIDAVGPLKGDVMDFDEFVEMMEIFRTNNGFTRNEVKDFRHSFDMFNTSQQEEVDVIQVGSILRSLGIGAELAQVQALVKTVDWNGSNSLDFNEFLRLMRLQREDELMSVKQVFDSKADACVTEDGNVRVTIAPKDVSSMFRGLGYPDSVGKSTMDLFLGLVREPLDYDALVLLVDSCRRMNMQKMRKQASFTDENVEKFRRLFKSLDSDGSGVIAQKELVKPSVRLFDDMGPVEAIRDVTREYALQSELATSPYICRVLGLVGVESLHNTMIGSGLMMELCEYPLHKALEQLSGPEHHRQKLLFSLHIASGLLCMHEKKLIHLDLKLDNILLNKHRSATGETSAVISDFGLCRRTDSSHNVTVRKNGVYAASYRCPEATALESDGERCSSRTTTVLSYSADMFAFGCCIYGIVSGRHLIHNVRAYQELCSGSFPEMVPEIVDKFVQRRLDQLFCDESDNLGAIVSSCLKGQALLRQSAGSARADLARKVEQLGTR